MTGPTPRAAALFALTVPPAFLILAARPEAWPFTLYAPLVVLAFLAADLAMTLPARRLAVTPAPPAGLAVGRTGTVGLELTAAGPTRPLKMTALLELAGEAEPPEPASGRLQEGRLKLELAFRPSRRGRLTLAAVWLRWRGPLGLVEVKERRPLGAPVDVGPDIRGLTGEALRFFAQDSALGQKSQRLKGEGAEFDRLADFTPGLDPRFIDWKSSARHRKLLVKEFRQERNHQIVFGFDTGHLMLEPIDGRPKLDHAIRAGLLLGWISLFHGDLVGGCAFDARRRGFLKPGRGRTYFNQLQRFTAGLDYQTEETNFTLGLSDLNGRLRRRALVVLFTEFVDTISAELLVESLAPITRRHLVIFVTLRDPMLERVRDAPPHNFLAAAEAVIADGFARDRATVLERVARLGVYCLDVPAALLSSALLNRYLLIKQRGLL
ncbi:MAG: DUF58 domain-containing protein [Candidatus Adiutrix sp.]|jgi:uncharacterized protein (DUF58 family)|nr:DUF58 domain-containing protein [Candidatus Adiutrix sp.]